MTCQKFTDKTDSPIYRGHDKLFPLKANYYQYVGTNIISKLIIPYGRIQKPVCSVIRF